MKKIIFKLLLGAFTSTVALATTPQYLCHLSISSSTGSSSICNAVHIGDGKLLSAAHCFPEGQKTVTNGIIIANCGDEEFMEFKKIKKSKDLKFPFNEDIALLEFSPFIKAETLNPTAYPSMYFAGNQVRDGVFCEILAFRGPYPSKNLKRIKIDKTMDLKLMDNTTGPAQIIMRQKNGGAIPEGLIVKEGDSGGALICRYSKMAKEELVGIIANYGKDRTTKEIIQNSFSPIFGSEAKKLLNRN